MPPNSCLTDRYTTEFERLYEAEYSGMLRYALTVFKAHGARYVSVSGRAEEAVQEAFSFAWEERAALLSSDSPVGRLYKILFYKVLEMLNEDRIWTKHIMQMSERDEDGPDFRLKIEMEDVISKEDYRLLKRLYLDGYSYKELCAEYHLGKSALAMRIMRIKERFREKYKSD